MDEKHKLFGNFEKTLKIFDENSIEKLNFYLVLGKVLSKNRAFGNNIIFLQHFSSSRAGVQTPLTPLRTPLGWLNLNCRFSATRSLYYGYSGQEASDKHFFISSHEWLWQIIFLLWQSRQCIIGRETTVPRRTQDTHFPWFPGCANKIWLE